MDDDRDDIRSLQRRQQRRLLENSFGLTSTSILPVAASTSGINNNSNINNLNNPARILNGRTNRDGGGGEIRISSRRNNRSQSGDESPLAREVIRLENPRPHLLRHKNEYVHVGGEISPVRQYNQNRTVQSRTLPSQSSSSATARVRVHRPRRADPTQASLTIDNSDFNRLVINENNNHILLNNNININNSRRTSPASSRQHFDNVFSSDDFYQNLNLISRHSQKQRRKISPIRTPVTIQPTDQFYEDLQRKQDAQRKQTSSLKQPQQNDQSFNKRQVKARHLLLNKDNNNGRQLIITNQPAKQKSSDFDQPDNKSVVKPTCHDHVHDRSVNGVTTPSIICKQCNKCRCKACRTPRPLPSTDLCNHRCLCSCDNVVDLLSCMKCVKGCWYHLDKCQDDCVSDDGGSVDYDDARDVLSCEKCSVSKAGCLCLSCVFLPCTWFYWPLKGCSWLCANSYARYYDNGCRCRLGNGSQHVDDRDRRRLNCCFSRERVASENGTGQHGALLFKIDDHHPP